ncbi:MAG: hypothetical protein ACKOTZ_05490, partial [Chloroflexota bacterium]
YLFAAVGTGLLLLPAGWRWQAWLATAAAIVTVNMHAILSLPFRGYGTPAMRALPFADLARTPVIVASVALACFPFLAWPLLAAWRLWRAGRVEAAAAAGAGAAAAAGTAAVTAGPPGPAAASGGVRLTRRPVLHLPLRQRIGGISLPRTIGLILVASLLAAWTATRFSGLAGGWLWNFDIPQVQYPFSQWIHAALWQGGLPFWVDTMAMGYPLYAEAQGALFYPPLWLIRLFPPLTALDLLRVSHLALAGAGIGCIVLRLTGVRTAALAAAVVAASAGGIVAKLEWTELVTAYAWIPWVLLPLAWSRGGPGIVAVALAGVAWGIQGLTGHPPTWALTGIAAVAVLLARTPGLRADPVRTLARVAGASLLLGGIGLAVSAAQTLPSLVLVSLSERASGLDAGQLFRSSATPWDILGFGFANAFVQATEPAWELGRTWYPGGTWGFLEAYAYLGLPAILLAVAGLRVRRARWLLVVAAILAAVPILGAFRPMLWAEIPVLNGLRHPVRAYMVIGLLAAVAAGFGIARIGRVRPGRAPVVALLVLLAAYAVTSFVVNVTPGLFEEIVRTTWGYPVGGNEGGIRALAAETLGRLWPLVGELALAAATLWLLRRDGPRLLLRCAAVALAVLPLLLLVPSVNRIEGRAAFDFGDRPLVLALREEARGQVVAVNEPGLGWSNQLALAGIRDLHAFSPLDLAANDRVLAALMAPAPDVALARAIGADTFVTFGGLPCTAGVAVRAVPENDATICRLDGVLTAPWWIPADLVTRPATGGGLLTPVTATADAAAVVAAAVPAVTVARSADSGTFTVSAPADGYVFIDRSWYPWWEATVDGAAAETLALWSGQLIPVPAGEHTIVQRFVPRDAQIGALISLLAFLGVMGAVLVARRERIRAMGATWRAGRARAAARAALAAAAGATTRRVRRHRRVFAGRVGRREVGIAALLFLVLAGMRVYNLDRPLGSYFDEVLYVRNAAEWLQGWRYGRLQDSNEWTHPPLSKEIVAASVEALGGHAVTRTGSVGAPIRDAVVEPGFAAGGGRDGRAPIPSRLYAATAESLLAIPLSGGGREIRLDLPGITRLALDPGSRILWLTGGDGVVAQVETALFDILDADPGSLADLAGEDLFPTIAELPDPVDRLWAFPGGGAAALVGSTLSLLGPDGVLGAVEAPGLTDVVWTGTDEQPRIALVVPDGVRIHAVPDLALVGRVAIDRRPLGATYVHGSDDLDRSRGYLDAPRLFVTTRAGLVTIGGLDGDAPFIDRTVVTPGPVTDARWNSSTNLVHLLGTEGGRPTIY